MSGFVWLLPHFLVLIVFGERLFLQESMTAFGTFEFIVGHGIHPFHENAVDPLHNAWLNPRVRVSRTNKHIVF